MSSSSTSRCVTARSTVGWIVAESPTPCSASSADRLLLRPRRHVELHEVRLDPIRVDGEPGLGEAEREPLRPRMVVRQPLDVVLERVDARGRDDPGLAHRAAEEVLEAARLAHHARTGRRAARRAGSRAPSRGRA